ncbi:MAG: pyridoxal kinase [Rhizobiaceae bacterium]
MTQQKPAIIVISSHVVRGTVGNRAAGFALEVLGYPVWLVPTVTLPWHPGQGVAERIVPPADEFSTLLDNLSNSPALNEVGAVLSGYLGNVEQVAAVAHLVDAVKARNSEALYALDPVLGDASAGEEGRLYVPKEQAEEIRNQLLPKADMITPNPFEMGWLAGLASPNNNEDLLAAARSLKVETVLATSASAMMRGNIANLLLHEDKATLAEHRAMNNPPNGLGDLAAALMLGNYMSNGDAVAALKKTSASLCEVMMSAARAGIDELPLEASVGSLLQPRMPVDVRTLGTVVVKPRK